MSDEPFCKLFRTPNPPSEAGIAIVATFHQCRGWSPDDVPTIKL
jgi:hypothetical protein